VSLYQNSTHEAQCSDLQVRLELAEKEKDERIAGQKPKDVGDFALNQEQLIKLAAENEQLDEKFKTLETKYRNARAELEDEEIENKRTQRVNESMVAQIDAVRDELQTKVRELHSVHEVVEDLEEERARLMQVSMRHVLSSYLLILKSLHAFFWVLWRDWARSGSLQS